MSRLETVRVLKEPIHDYIGISALENALINDPLFLRLQYISQNGLAYLTYPSNRTSRFIHSLGTMHIGGQMILSVINSCDQKLRESFFKSFKEVMNQAAENVSMTVGQVGGFISSQADIFYRSHGFTPEAPRDIEAIVLLQSMRIACVMHDLGHPPFSHSTEMVLKSKLNSLNPSKASEEYRTFGKVLSNLRKTDQGQLHEKMGKELVYYVFSHVGGELANFGKFCFWIANRILTPERASEDPKGILTCLHSIVSGESVDADRCDYVLRDGNASSFEFGEYDITRILHNLRLTTNSRGDFEIGSTTTAASALESFFLERYRIWRWIVFHPNVVRSEIALSRALNILLEMIFSTGLRGPEKTLHRILTKFDFPKLWRSFENESRYRDYISCDESWLLALFREIQHSIEGESRLRHRIIILKCCIDFVLDRKKSSNCFAALWKRAEEYEDFARAVQDSMASHMIILEKASLLPGTESATEWLNSLIRKVLTKDLLDGEVECLRRLEDRLQNSLRKAGFEGALLTRVLSFTPYKECLLMSKTGDKIPLSKLSSIVENLNPTWNRDIQFRTYWISLRTEGERVFLDNLGKVPSRRDLANCFLEALLDEPHWASLSVLLGR